MMDIESSEQQNNQEFEFDIEPLTQKNNKKLELSKDAQSMASSIYNRRSRIVQMNKNIDSNNSAQRYQMKVTTKEFGSFYHFLTKNKHRNVRIEMLEAVRQLAQERGFVLSGRVSDKLERSKMILRVVAKEQIGEVFVEDQTGKQKMMVRNGTVWVGMIALMEVIWVDGCYRLENVQDLGVKPSITRPLLREPNNAYRMLFVKGALMNNESRDNIGLKIIINELRQLKDRQKTKINCLVIMGPLLNRKNKTLTDFIEHTFEEEAEKLIKVIKDEINNISDQIEIVFMPSTEDLTNFYPVPQPKYSHEQQLSTKLTHFTSNPGFIKLEGAKQDIKIDLINVDILNYIDQNRTGRSIGQIMQQNLQTYLKQPFYLTNTIDEPFDETNLPGMYNKGVFGDIIVMSSRKSPPFAREVKGKMFVNIGCLGIDEQNGVSKHFMTLMSIYEGTGAVSPRVKVETLSM